jgi:hypothetical protein
MSVIQRDLDFELYCIQKNLLPVFPTHFYDVPAFNIYSCHLLKERYLQPRNVFDEIPGQNNNIDEEDCVLISGCVIVIGC